MCMHCNLTFGNKFSVKISILLIDKDIAGFFVMPEI